MKQATESSWAAHFAPGISLDGAYLGIAWLGKFLLWSFAFGLAYTQAPLYTSNQNTKFVIGLADGGMGFLREDWLANTTDAFPVFSFLVSFTYTHLPEYMFYFFNILMFGVYLFSLAGIVSRIFDLGRDQLRYMTFLAVMLALHSYAVDSYSMRLLGVEMGQLFHYGVAGQHIIGRIFQPSVFGVFILLSIYAFLSRKIFLAAVLATLPAVFHPAYIFAAALITLSYMLVVFSEERSVKKPLAVGMLNLLLVAPVLAYSYMQLSPTSPELWQKASEIIVNFRSPHHMKAEVWINELVYAKLGLVALALFMIRSTKLFPVMLLPLVMIVLITLAQWFLQNNTLAYATPWRASVFLVPLALAIVVGWAVARLFETWAGAISNKRRVMAGAIYAMTAMLVFYGMRVQVKRHEKYYADDSVAMMNFVRETKTSGETYLVPVELEDFRLYTGAPTFVTFKSGPVKDVDYLEWYRRFLAAREFYLAENDRACSILNALETKYSLTHVVVKNASERRCGNLAVVYEDDQYRIYRIEEKSSLVVGLAEQPVTTRGLR